MPEMSLRPQNIRAAAPWVAVLPAEVVSDLAAQLQHTSLVSGKRLYEAGDVSDGIYGVRHGMAAIHSDDADRADILAHLLGPGAWFGEAGALSGRPRIVSLVARTDLALWHLSQARLFALADRHPVVWRGLGVLCAANSGIAVQVARDLMLTHPADRVCATLSRLVGAQPLPCALPLTQGELAVLCGLSRGPVARILAQQEAAGTVARGYGCIQVLRHRTPAPPAPESRKPTKP